MSDNEIDQFVASLAPPIAATVERLRPLVLGTIPNVRERLRPGWRLLGYDLPDRKHGGFFAWIWPEDEHVHLGFEVGTLMADPDGVLRGAHLKLKKVRYFTFAPGARIPRAQVTRYVRDAARIAALPRAERQLIALERREHDGPARP